MDIPPAPMDIVPVVPKLNIPGSAGASAAYAMEVSSAAAGTLRETGSQASAAPNPAYQNVQGIYTTEELVAEKQEQYDNIVGEAPLSVTDEGEALPPPAMTPYLAQEALPCIERLPDGEVVAEYVKPCTATSLKPMADTYENFTGQKTSLGRRNPPGVSSVSG